jgi:hypothetical protein
MDATAVPGAASRKAPGAPRAAQVFLGDARLAAGAINYGRHLALGRVFGVSRAQENLLTFVLALAAADAALTAAHRVLHAPFHLSGSNAAAGGVLVHEAVLGIAGPGARKVPLAGTLLTVAMLGALVPGVRRTARSIHDAELRVRRQRMSVYAARRAANDRGDAA